MILITGTIPIAKKRSTCLIRIEKYMARTLPVHAIYGYESIMVIADALKRCDNPDDPEAVRDAIATSEITEHVLPQGVIKFDETGENINSAGVLVEIREGKHVIVYPEEYADHEE